MLKRILLQGILITGIQAIIISILFSIVWFFARHAISETITEAALSLSKWLFVIITSISNVIIACVNRKTPTILLSILAGLVFSLLWIEDALKFLLPTVLVILSGLISVAAGCYLHLKSRQPSTKTSNRLT
jgi:hypothetical protein